MNNEKEKAIRNRFEVIKNLANAHIKAEEDGLLHSRVEGIEYQIKKLRELL